VLRTTINAIVSGKEADHRKGFPQGLGFSGHVLPVLSYVGSVEKMDIGFVVRSRVWLLVWHQKVLFDS
jgi:hypothetical protein